MPKLEEKLDELLKLLKRKSELLDELHNKANKMEKDLKVLNNEY